MTTIYIAEFKWREYRIVSVEVLKETAKQYKVERSTVKGYPQTFYVPSVVHKDSYNTFATLIDAKRWCLGQLRIHVDGLEAQMVTAQNTIAELQAEIEAVSP